MIENENRPVVGNCKAANNQSAGWLLPIINELIADERLAVSSSVLVESVTTGYIEQLNLDDLPPHKILGRKLLSLLNDVVNAVNELQKGTREAIKLLQYRTLPLSALAELALKVHRFANVDVTGRAGAHPAMMTHSWRCIWEQATTTAFM